MELLPKYKSTSWLIIAFNGYKSVTCVEEQYSSLRLCRLDSGPKSVTCVSEQYNRINCLSDWMGDRSANSYSPTRGSPATINFFNCFNGCIPSREWILFGSPFFGFPSAQKLRDQTTYCSALRSPTTDSPPAPAAARLALSYPGRGKSHPPRGRAWLCWLRLA